MQKEMSITSCCPSINPKERKKNVQKNRDRNDSRKKGEEKKRQLDENESVHGKVSE
jgi:hypothetical protein